MQFLKATIMCLCLGVSLLPMPRVDCNGSEDIDPFDMVNFDQTTLTMRKETAVDIESTSDEPESETEVSKVYKRAPDSSGGGDNSKQPPVTKDQGIKITSTSYEETLLKMNACPRQMPCPAQSLFQQYVSKLLRFLRDKVQQTDENTATDICLRLSLSPYHLTLLENFRKDDSADGVFRAHEILTQAMHGAHAVGADDPSFHILWIEEKFGVSVEKAVQVMFFFVLSALALLILSRLQLHLRLFLQLLVLAFIVSVMTTWYRLYKGEVAKQHETMMKELPRGCMDLPEGSSSIEKIFNLYRQYFTFQKDQCVEYYERMIVDPIVKVSIMEALAVAVVQTVLKPMRTVGTELSEFIRALVKDLPVQWQFVTVVFVFAFIILAMFLCCGYRLRVPFLLAIEPSHSDKTQIKQLRQQVLSLQSQVESIGSVGQRAENGQPLLPQPAPAARRAISLESLPALQPGTTDRPQLAVDLPDQRTLWENSLDVTSVPSVKTGNCTTCGHRSVVEDAHASHNELAGDKGNATMTSNTVDCGKVACLNSSGGDALSAATSS